MNYSKKVDRIVYERTYFNNIKDLEVNDMVHNFVVVKKIKKEKTVDYIEGYNIILKNKDTKVIFKRKDDYKNPTIRFNKKITAENTYDLLKMLEVVLNKKLAYDEDETKKIRNDRDERTLMMEEARKQRDKYKDELDATKLDNKTLTRNLSVEKNNYRSLEREYEKIKDEIERLEKEVESLKKPIKEVKNEK